MSIKNVLFITVVTAVGLLVFYDGSVTIFESNSVKNAVAPRADNSSEQITSQWSESDSIIAFENLVKSPPPYLKGTDLRGAIPVDQNNQLIVHRKMKQRFDYYFLMSTDLDHDQIVNIIRGNILSELDGEAQAQALSILNDYSQYLLKYNLLISQYGDSHISGMSQHDLKNLLQDIQQLRLDTLGVEVSDAFFKQEAWLQKRVINGLAEEDSEDLDGQSQEWIEQQTKTLLYETQKKSLLQAMGNESNPEALRLARIQTYGEDATTRLEALDASRNEFQKNLKLLRSLQQAQRENGLSDQENRSALEDQLKQQKGLSELEIRRLFVVAEIR